MPMPGWTGYADVCVHGLRPTLLQYARQYEPSVASIHWVNCAVAPEPSDRTTGTIWIAGRLRPGLSRLIAGSFHLLRTPVNILAMFVPDRRRFVTRLVPMLRLYMNVVPPAVSGMYANPRVVGGGSKKLPSCTPYGMSDAAKSTTPCLNCVRPFDEPFGV